MIFLVLWLSAMDGIINTVIAQDLTGSQETSLLHGIATIKGYDDLTKVGDILSFLQPSNAVALLFPTGLNPGHGHWIGIWFDSGTRTVHHFDSYGFGPEGELKYSTNPLVKHQLLNQMYSKAQAQGIRVVWNTFPFQKMSDNINTCGRHVICRLRFKYLNEAQYIHLMARQKMTPDQIVTFLTFLALDEGQQYAQKIIASV